MLCLPAPLEGAPRITETESRPLEDWLEPPVSEREDEKCLVASLGVGSVPIERGLGAVLLVLEGMWGILQAPWKGRWSGCGICTTEVTPEETGVVSGGRQALTQALRTESTSPLSPLRRGPDSGMVASLTSPSKQEAPPPGLEWLEDETKSFV